MLKEKKKERGNLARAWSSRSRVAVSGEALLSV